MDDLRDLRIGNIERKKKIKITVNGQDIFAYKGETLLAALIAAGFKGTKKSPLKHQPRGALCGMGVCFECIVSVNDEPNIRSCMTEVEENMRVKTDEGNQ